MSKDLEVIAWLKKEGIELEEVESLNNYDDNIVQLKIKNKKVTTIILEALGSLTNLERLDLEDNLLPKVSESVKNLLILLPICSNIKRAKKEQ